MGTVVRSRARTQASRRIRSSLVAGTVAVAIVLVASGCVVVPGDPGPVDVTLSVDTTLDRRAISPYIYGSNAATDVAANGLTLLRLGGNRWTAYNWENNASNAGSDWCHQNDGYLSSSSTPGAAVRAPVTAANAAGASAALVTVPIVDHVAADKDGGSAPPSCSGDVRASGPDYLTTRFRSNDPTKGGPFGLTPSTADGSVYQDEFVNWAEQELPGELLYSLDNEPDLWSQTHAEVHPSPVTYAELVQRDVDYAAAIRAVAPDATITGPVNYGYWGTETLQSAPDAGAHGNFVEYWLDQMAAAEAASGTRLVDLLDLHWYPEARGDGLRITGPQTSAGVVEARIQAPRSLWDDDYVEDSWITNDILHGPIRLLPALRERIDAYHPGTGLAVTEWNYGGGGHISGAMASADALGVFGREGVDVACLWELNADESYTYAAFKAFRNFDGAGGRFGDTSVRATTSDVDRTTVYASVDSTDADRVVLVAVNKSSQPTTAGIGITHVGTFSAADVYTVTQAGGPAPVAAGSIDTVATNAFRVDLPPMSISVVVPRATAT